jgi:ribonuclease Z
MLKAIDRFHSTASQAAEIAKRADVGKLIIGHFSSKYKDLNPFLLESQQIFPSTELAFEGKTFEW